jgi:hypothetical protein
MFLRILFADNRKLEVMICENVNGILEALL